MTLHAHMERVMVLRKLAISELIAAGVISDHNAAAGNLSGAEEAMIIAYIQAALWSKMAEEITPV